MELSQSGRMELFFFNKAARRYFLHLRSYLAEHFEMQGQASGEALGAVAATSSNYGRLYRYMQLYEFKEIS
jgi:hypothetical protein